MDGGTGEDLFIVSLDGRPGHVIISDRDVGNTLSLQRSQDMPGLGELPITSDVPWEIKDGALVFAGPASGMIRFGDQIIEFRGIDRIVNF
jgi:hypothetical protein